MTRCIAAAYVTAVDFKRCIKDGDDAHDDHLWVEATSSGGSALVVRWRGFSKQPSEILIARKEA